MRSYLLGIIICLLQLACTSQTSKINGVSFVASGKPIDSTHVAPVVSLHANYAAIMPFGFMRSLDATEIYHNTDRQWFGETRAGAKQYIQELNRKHINVMIKPQIWVRNGEFTGFIQSKSEEDWQQLEKAYESFILEYAALAEKVNAPMYCIGTELHTFVSKRPKFWGQLIEKIRTVYKGKLTYAENWDSFEKVPFWNQLDYIGIDAYFPLSDEKLPSVETLQSAWQPYKQKIETLSKKYDKKIVFTEYGYRSMEYNAKEPWNSDRGKTLHLEAQEIALTALYEEFWSENWFAGGFVWKWFIDHENSGGSENTHFTPQNKSAEKVIRTYYMKYK